MRNRITFNPSSNKYSLNGFEITDIKLITILENWKENFTNFMNWKITKEEYNENCMLLKEQQDKLVNNLLLNK